MRRRPVPVMALALAALLLGIWAGWVRIGWAWPPLRPSLPAFHGPLMVAGFLATLIGVERAVALKGRRFLVGPLLTGLGGLAGALGAPVRPAALLIALGGLGLVAALGTIYRRHRALFTAAMLLGALAFAGGGLLLALGWPLPRVVPWWIAFLVWTILGERLELARLTGIGRGPRRLFLTGMGLWGAGLLVSLGAYGVGVGMTGLGSLLFAAWLLRYDVARRTVWGTGLPRFIAVSLLSGYVWLAASGLLALAAGGVPAGPLYDGYLHTLFLGFVFAMIFAHAPIILPSVLGVSVPFRRAFYGPLALLHLSLLLRVGADLAGWSDGRLWGGLLNGIAILWFLANTAAAVWAGKRA